MHTCSCLQQIVTEPTEVHLLPQPAKVVTDLRMNLLQGAEKGHKWWPSKVGDGTQACEQAPVEDLLEVTFTDVLERDQPIVRTELLVIWRTRNLCSIEGSTTNRVTMKLSILSVELDSWVLSERLVPD